MRSNLLCLAKSILVVLITGTGVAQTVDNRINVGFPPNGTFDGSNFDSVQLNNGNLHLDIPIVGLKGRGISTGSKYVYDNKIWKYITNCNHFTGLCTDTMATETSAARVLHAVNTFVASVSPGTVKGQQCSPGVTQTTYTNYVVTDPNGTKHHMLPDPALPNGNSCWGPLGTMYA